jgi:hypothetical protein
MSDIAPAFSVKPPPVVPIVFALPKGLPAYRAIVSSSQ